MNTMKEGIHPQYSESVVKCGCGNAFTTRSTVPEIKIDICNVCTSGPVGAWPTFTPVPDSGDDQWGDEVPSGV